MNQHSPERPARQLSDQTRALFAHLWQGGAAAYYWRSDFKTSTWFDTSRIINPPGDVNIYFGVHPTGHTRGKHQRSTIDSVAAINCLFAEFDAAQYGDLAGAMAHVDQLKIPPSVLLCSGGGYHAYWLLSEPERVTDDNREELRRLQGRWVSLVGGDPGAKDLARVLRVPGSLNAKYQPPRPVEFVWYGADYFPLDCLRMHLQTFGKPEPAHAVPAWPEPPPAKRATDNPARLRAYGQAAMVAELMALSAARKGERNNELYKTAAALGNLVAAGMVDQPEAIGNLYGAALNLGLDASFTDHDVRVTINSGFKDGLRSPRVPKAQPNDA